MEPDGTDCVSHLEKSLSSKRSLRTMLTVYTTLRGRHHRRNTVFNNSWIMEMHVCASVCECIKHGQ